MDGWMDALCGCMDVLCGCMVEPVDVWMNEWMYGCTLRMNG
jgi:hypothetical protein